MLPGLICSAVIIGVLIYFVDWNVLREALKRKDVRVNGIRPETLDQIHYSDPVAQELCRMRNEINLLRKEVEKHDSV